MKPYSKFIFDSSVFDPEEGKVELRYSLDDEMQFTETLLLPEDYQLQSPSPRQDAALAALHLIAGVSYYKTCLPKEIEIRSGSLSPEQADFWNTVYRKGLGEFFYRNQIDFRGLVNFPASKAQVSKPAPNPNSNPKPKLLVPIGGGKDSAVTTELLKHAGYDVTLFRIGKHPLIEQAAKTAGLPLLTVERHLAPELFRLNAEGALNGHVPITGFLSFLTILIAELYGFHAIVMSNEGSASEGNVEYLGEMINHQWSKSVEFERLIRQYLAGMGTSVEYFSLLRPLSELAITKNFAAMPQYFHCTTSCNANWKILSKNRSDLRWCGVCPKCAFVFAMLAAFLPKKTLLEIFAKNLFDETSLLPLYRQLLGIGGFKPFECVGTPEETQAAFLLAHERGDLEQTTAMQLFLQEVLPSIRDSKKLIDDALTPSPEHCIPPGFQMLIS